MKRIVAFFVFAVFALMTSRLSMGQAVVGGSVYEMDSITPIVGASVTFSGLSLEGDTLVYQFLTDTLGHFGDTDTLGQYIDSISFGLYWVWAAAEGYDTAYIADSLFVEEGMALVEVDFFLSEIVEPEPPPPYLPPVSYITAQQFTSDLVRISWSRCDSLGEDGFYGDGIRFCQDGSLRNDHPDDPVFLYYELFRSRFDEEPVMLASHLSDTLFMDMNWSSLPWGKYHWGVSCYYGDYRGYSDTIWSEFLDKSMTTLLEITATTNVGLVPAGATVWLTSHDTQSHSYQADLDAEGHLVLPEVYRDDYDLRVHLDGFVDYVSDEPISIFEPTQFELELTEAIIGIENLYVSSTGYAIWRLSNPQYRDLQCYELKLDGAYVGTVTSTSFLFDVSDLNAGDTCIVQVRPVYLSGSGEWFSSTWVYHPCSDFQGSVDGLHWSSHDDAVLLSWNYPEEGSFLGAWIYREGEFLGFTESNFFVDETVEMHGEVMYGMRLVYDGPWDGTYYSMSCMEYELAPFLEYCDPPVKLDAEVYYENDSDYGIMVSWGERPDPIYQWLHYDDGVFKRALGGDDEPIIFWSIRYSAEVLDDYMGCSLKKVSIFDVGAGTYQWWIFVGGETAPRTLVRFQNMTLTNAQAWHEEIVDPPLDIPENEPIWIVIGQQGLSRPAAACADQGNPDGRWVSLDGETWTDMHAFNMHYTWMLRALVSNPWGQSMTLREEGYVLQHYNLYRSYHNSNYQNIASIPAVEGQVYYEYRDPLGDDPNDYYYYQLTAIYLSDEGEVCESDPAMSLSNPNHDYVMIDLWSTPESVTKPLNVYPNPAKDWVTVEAEGMRHVVVMNELGQRVMDKEIDANTLQLDFSDFETGMYLLQVITENGTMNHRIVISR